MYLQVSVIMLQSRPFSRLRAYSHGEYGDNVTLKILNRTATSASREKMEPHLGQMDFSIFMIYIIYWHILKHKKLVWL